eukprot:jgi/Psemu1/20082/gm1.20082_g
MLTCSDYFQATASSPFGSMPAERNEAYKNTIYGYFTPDITPQLVVHGLRKYPGPLAQPSLNTGNTFGYIDDIERDAGDLVQVNSDMLSKTPASRVLSLGHHIAELDPHRQRPYIPAVQEGAAHSKMISTHKAFFIPFELVPFLLGKGFPHCQAVGILYPYLNPQGLMGTCAPLFDTLRVARTFPTVPVGDPTLIQPGPPFQIEPGLTNYMRNKVLRRPGGAYCGGDSPRRPPPAEAQSHMGPLVHQALGAALWKAGGNRPPPIYQPWAEREAQEDPTDLPELSRP